MEPLKQGYIQLKFTYEWILNAMEISWNPSRNRKSRIAETNYSVIQLE